jgi:hypothetical protein
MNQPSILQSWNVGEAIRAAKLNQPVDLLNRMRGNGPARQHMPHPIPEGEAAEATTTFVAVAAIEGATLLVRAVSRNIVDEQWDGRWRAGVERTMLPWPHVDVDAYADSVAAIDGDGLVVPEDAILRACPRDGLWFVVAPSEAGGPTLCRFRTTYFPHLSDSYKAYNIDTDEAEVTVYKPYELRVTPWNGRTKGLAHLNVSVTYDYYLHDKRRATRSDGRRFMEIVIPQWHWAQEVWAMQREGIWYQIPDSRAWAVWQEL